MLYQAVGFGKVKDPVDAAEGLVRQCRIQGAVFPTPEGMDADAQQLCQGLLGKVVFGSQLPELLAEFRRIEFDDHGEFLLFGIGSIISYLALLVNISSEVVL